MDSVKVVVRVRPFNDREITLNSKCIIKMKLNKTTISTPRMSKDFIYDASYWSFNFSDPHYKSQADIYEDIGIEVADKTLTGLNTCICAYGQTGSGKSYSMMGLTNSTVHEGIVPRICKKIISYHTCYQVYISFLEVYNENIIDLLASKESPASIFRVHQTKTGTQVDGLSQHLVNNYSDIEQLLIKGNNKRTTASTKMNTSSSRSHAIFSLKIKAMHNNQDNTISCISLVDLAGSERADTTGATGVTLRESANINKSLLAFINVISKLAKSDSKLYIPYRDSMLTWLLKDNLGGSTKTVVLATISPADVNFDETMSTLRYANSAKNIKIKVNTLKINKYKLVCIIN